MMPESPATTSSDTGDVFVIGSSFDPYPGFTFGHFIGFSADAADADFTSVTIAGDGQFSWVVDSMRFSPIPEPSSTLLFAAGALVVGVALRKKAVA